MDKADNHAAGNNTKESGKSLGDLLRALNSFQDSLGEMMDEDDVAVFSFKNKNMVFGSGYRIEIPDGFKVNLQSVNQAGQPRDFLAWTPSDNEKADFVLNDIDEEKAIELLHNGSEDAEGKKGSDIVREVYEDMLKGGVNQSKISMQEYSFGKITGGFIRRVMSSMCYNYYVFLELNGRVLKLRVIFNNKYSIESMDRNVSDWIDTITWPGNEAAEAARRAEEERIAREEAERKAAEEAARRAEEERIAREEAERKAAEEAARRAEEERIAREEAERRAAEEAARRAEEERIAREEAERKAAEEAARAAEEAARKAEEERIAREEAERKAAEEAARKAEEERLATLAKVEAARKIASDKAREEAAKLEIEKAEKERIEAERAAIEAEQREKEEAVRLAKEAEEKAKADAARRAREEKEAEEKALAEKAAKEKAEAERIAREKALKEAAERAAREEAERKAKDEAERKAKEDAAVKAAIEAGKLAAAKAAAAQYEMQRTINSGAVNTASAVMDSEAKKSATLRAENVEAERLAEKQRRDELRQREERRREEEQHLKIEEEKRHAQLKKHAEDLRMHEDMAIGKLKEEKEKLIQQRAEIASEINSCMLEKAEIEKQYDLERNQFMQFENQVNATLFNAQGRKKELEAQAQESENRYIYKEQTERKRLLKLKDDLRTAFAAAELAGEIEAIFREKAASGKKKKVLLYKMKTEERENAEKELDSIKNQFEIAQINSKNTIEEHQKVKEKFDKELAELNEVIDENQSVITAKKESMQQLKDRSKVVDERRSVANQKIKDIENSMREIDVKIREEEAKH